MSRAADVVGQVPAGSDPGEYDRLRRRVLWRMPTGLYVLGSRHGEERNLMTCSLVVQVATDPKLLVVSIERSALTCRLVREGRCFALSLVARTDRAEIRKFVKPAAHDAKARTLAGSPYRDAPVTGAPVLAQAAAYIDCRVANDTDLGSHVLFTGEVVDAAFGEAGEDVDVLRMEDTRMSYGG